MLNSKWIKPFLITTIILKVIIDITISVYYLIDSLYFFAIAYIIFNAYIIYSIAKEKAHELKATITTAIVSDQIYSLILSLFFTKKIHELVFFYPTTSLLYFMGIETFLKSKITLIITTIFSSLFFLHASYIIINIKQSLINYCFLLLFFAQIIFMIYKISLIKGDKNG